MLGVWPGVGLEARRLKHLAVGRPQQTNAFLAQCRSHDKAAAKDSLQRAHVEIESLKHTISAMRRRHAAQVADLRAQSEALKVVSPAKPASLALPTPLVLEP